MQKSQVHKDQILSLLDDILKNDEVKRKSMLENSSRSLRPRLSVAKDEIMNSKLKK